MVKVLPVPALASSTVVPQGSSPQTSNTSGTVVADTALIGGPSWRLGLLVVEQRLPDPAGEDAQAAALVRPLPLGVVRCAEQHCERGVLPPAADMVRVGPFEPAVPLVPGAVERLLL